jgi:GNAT superfamily N-acetyltransferase
LALTKKGRAQFDALDEGSNREVGAMLAGLPAQSQTRLIAAMRTIEEVFGAGTSTPSQAPYLLRPHQPGDMGWVVHRHGVLYAREYGYDETFEALVATIVAAFVEHFDPARERCWIAERGGEVVGSVFLVQKSKTIAKLRLLLVEPSARGLGNGRRHVEECIRFARERGYRTLTLWTHSELSAARRIYKETGFRLARRQSDHSFGKDLVAETWELDLHRRA